MLKSLGFAVLITGSLSANFSESAYNTYYDSGSLNKISEYFYNSFESSSDNEKRAAYNWISSKAMLTYHPLLMYLYVRATCRCNFHANSKYKSLVIVKHMALLKLQKDIELLRVDARNLYSELSNKFNNQLQRYKPSGWSDSDDQECVLRAVSRILGVISNPSRRGHISSPDWIKGVKVVPAGYLTSSKIQVEAYAEDTCRNQYISRLHGTLQSLITAK